MADTGKYFPLRYAFSHGALPAGVLGALADFGTPVGLHWFGWGLAALYLVALGLFVAFPGARERAYDFMCAPDPARRQPFLVNPFALALLAGAVIAGGGGALSYLSRQEGGFLASNVEMLREVQATNLLLAQSLEVQQEISGKLDDVKRETSDNPAKELANLGFEMSPNGVQSAISLGNVEAVDLFADAKTRVTASSFGLLHPISREIVSPVWKVIAAGETDMARALSRLGTANDPLLCLGSPGAGRGAADILARPEQRQAFKQLCSGGLAEQAMRDAWEERQALLRELPARTSTCVAEATAYLAALDIAMHSGQMFNLAAAHHGKLAGTGTGPLRVDEAAASLASQFSPEARLIGDGTKMEMRLSRKDVATGAAEACAQVLDPSHPANNAATRDEDYQAMLAALDD